MPNLCYHIYYGNVCIKLMKAKYKYNFFGQMSPHTCNQTCTEDHLPCDFPFLLVFRILYSQTGGPHSLFSTDFKLYTAGFCRCGYACLLSKWLKNHDQTCTECTHEKEKMATEILVHGLPNQLIYLLSFEHTGK